ncbi:MAG TPA: hypothetical protein VMH23_09170 [Bacteroidota bacterium]|nr:hypothetical protein [Bacteroidota bacterium]
MPIYIWIGLAIFVGLLGRKTPFGFWGNFALSMLFSPLVPLVIYVVISMDRKNQRRANPTH